MTQDTELKTIHNNTADKVSLDLSKKNDFSLEELVHLLITSKIQDLEKQTKNELKELQTRQTRVRFFHKLLSAINASTDNKGNFNYSSDDEMKKLFEQAREWGLEIDLAKTKYGQEEKGRLVESIRLVCEDLNIENEMQLQTITRLTNERYEMYQMARSILKPLHDDKVNKARAASGR